MAYGITERGLTIPTFNDILESQKLFAKQLFGNDIDLSTDSPLEKIITITAYQLSQAWQTIENMYYEGFIDAATGTNLDALGIMLGIERNPSVSAIGTITIEGTEDTIIPCGQQFSDLTNSITYSSLEEVTIGEEGVVSVNVKCDTGGKLGNMEAHTIVRQCIPMVAGVTSVYNESAMILGVDKETDTAYRYRIKHYSAIARDKATRGAIEHSIAELDGVTGVTVYDDADHPGYIYVIVSGGDEDEIAEVVEATRAAGIVPVISQASDVPLTITCELAVTSTTTDATKDTIKVAAESYIEAIVDELNMGDAVLTSAFIKYLLSIPNVIDVTTFTVTDGETTISTLGESLTVEVNEIATLDSMSVVIT